ncbi:MULTISPECIES: siroheme synthase CysG [Bosea]|uniref:siroheme synthase CysG n=1 Tax=Bosea TaxID=85413 RepID=UPI00214FC12D|nr:MULTISPECIES: siroheme synthase CysG [Bosea]MCR4521804.1 siroheme synthase CysG [Bosea sp. 47.2.35]MDR6827327.1 uroporphyrin-III C-methyltransferase/precorrin-2 dehydrogenase/sirohydrochlorin ferrochelatase [Bosea robiniae]MDR6894037.1 uroporphyrin-III C-methyltransferase/precorrin-2 dehydrogenase/sirohydrochlorin ferrochelatase [Bosea sp. BE109]MDR7137432.1 uroporphyrin-III C-methyltransferase/precorrin-2 dehydrogenase/sirohydrochlorin ferrochelatase [Bosea sp. BE168]MDR7174132.1 uroporphy
MTERQPESTAARIEPLATLPLFHKLVGRKVVLAGGTEGALWKAELLAATGAELHVFAAGEGELFAGLAQGELGRRVHVHERAWQADDLTDAAIAVADLDDADAVRAFVAAARQAGVPVNIVDKPEHCDFAFGALVNRSPLIVAVSTDGAAPVFGQAIRTKIEALLPTGLKNWAQAAADWRPAVQARELPFALRRSFWELFAGKAMAEPERTPNLDDEAELFAKLSRIEADHDGKGRVTLVGAGPGDPELLTLKAIRALQSADIILYDDLVSPGVLELARREAKRMLVGKTGYGPSVKQGDINALIVSLAAQGKHVVRLKGGDPGIFGRAGEEIEACQAAGVPVAIVPGISAAQGAAASLGLSLTHRDHARRLQFVTGHSRKGELPDDLDWRAMADPAASTVIYMARATLPGFRERAIAAGLDPQTPAVAVLAATRPDEQRIATTISDLPERLGELPANGPVLVLLGHAFGPALPAANPAEDRRRA